MINSIKNRLRQMVRHIVKEELSSHAAGEHGRLLAFISSQEAAYTMARSLANTPTVWGDASRIATGKNVHLVNTLLNTSSGRIEIGDDTFFGHDVSLITGTHPIEETREARQSFPVEGRDIIIGKGVWIATNAVVLGPCTIGDDAVIAAGAVVIGGSVPAGSIYGGVPARLIRSKLESGVKKGVDLLGSHA